MTHVPPPLPAKMRPEEKILWILIASCLLASVVLAVLATSTEYWFPPMLMAMLLGIAVAALTYRFLGGVDGSGFVVSGLTLGGSAAVLVGTAFLTNIALTTQVDAAWARQDKARTKREQFQQKINDLEVKLANAGKNGRVDLVKAVGEVQPGSDVGEQLVKMSKEKLAAWAELRTETLRVSVVRAEPSRFYICPNLNLAGATLNLSYNDPNSDDEIKKVMGRQAGAISQGYCGKGRKFDLQIGCEDGKVLFPVAIAGCDAQGVKWRPGKKQIFEVFADIQKG